MKKNQMFSFNIMLNILLEFCPQNLILGMAWCAGL